MSIFNNEDQPQPLEIGMEVGRVRDLLADCDTCEQLTEWEHNFCNSLYERVLRFAEATRLSDKQWAVLEKIEAKVRRTS